jgi:hypothetical protein
VVAAIVLLLQGEHQRHAGRKVAVAGCKEESGQLPCASPP